MWLAQKATSAPGRVSRSGRDERIEKGIKGKGCARDEMMGMGKMTTLAIDWRRSWDAQKRTRQTAGSAAAGAGSVTRSRPSSWSMAMCGHNAAWLVASRMYSKI